MRKPLLQATWAPEPSVAEEQMLPLKSSTTAWAGKINAAEEAKSAMLKGRLKCFMAWILQ
jgi:hypothetical protein